MVQAFETAFEGITAASSNEKRQLNDQVSFFEDVAPDETVL